MSRNVALPPVPEVVGRAIDRVVDKAYDNGLDLLDILHPYRIAATEQRVIEYSNLPFETLPQRRAASRTVLYALGRYAQNNRLL